MKKLSIITINYNNKPGLEKTIKSVIDQEFTDYEYIVIDGGSTDGSKEVIKSFQNQLDYWCSEPDGGIFNAMNKGILKSTGKYILFLNSGDYLENNILESIKREITQQDIIYGDLNFVQGGKIKYTEKFPNALTAAFFFNNYLGHPSTFIKRELFNTSLYSENLHIVADWEFFFKKIVIENCSYKHIDFIISNFNIEGVSSINIEENVKEREHCLKSLLPEKIYYDLQQLSILEKSPMISIIPKLNKTKKFQRRMVKLVSFLLKINNLFSKH